MNYSYQLLYDLPIPYRNISIYPLTVRDYLMLTLYSPCLTVDKDSIPDSRIISMSELEYLFYATQTTPEKTPYLYFFDRLLHLSLKNIEEIDTFENPEISLLRYKLEHNKKPYFVIGNEKYTNSDFLIIKEILSEQNMVELPDKNISKEVRDSIEKAKEYKSKLHGGKPGNFDDYITSLAVVTGWTFEYIYGLTIRKFISSIRRLDNLIHYKIYLSASMSGMAEFKDTSFIKHWLSDLNDDDKYGEVTLSLDEMQGKISLDNAKT